MYWFLAEISRGLLTTTCARMTKGQAGKHKEGGSISLTNAPAAITTVASVRTWRGSQFSSARGPMPP